MKYSFVLFSFMLLTLIIGCCNSKPTNEIIELNKNINQNQPGPASIVPNLSVVTARVDEVLYKDETDYQLKVTVLVVEENDSYTSIAVPGNEYLLTPNFRYENEELIQNNVNESLKRLSKLSEGKEFKAEISLENQKGWFVQKVLSIE